MKIQIGSIKTEYTVYETNAPAIYDGFATITIRDDWPLVEYNDNPGRLVLVQTEHLEWYAYRYSSGLFYHGIPKYIDWRAIEDILIKRLCLATDTEKI